MSEKTRYWSNRNKVSNVSFLLCIWESMNVKAQLFSYHLRIVFTAGRTKTFYKPRNTLSLETFCLLSFISRTCILKMRERFSIWTTFRFLLCCPAFLCYSRSWNCMSWLLLSTHFISNCWYRCIGALHCVVPITWLLLVTPNELLKK